MKFNEEKQIATHDGEAQDKQVNKRTSFFVKCDCKVVQLKMFMKNLTGACNFFESYIFKSVLIVQTFNWKIPANIHEFSYLIVNPREKIKN